MEGKDSYHPANTNDNVIDVNTDSIIQPDENQVSSEDSSGAEAGDVPEPGGWDGSEAEIVVDDETEEYEEETTGIKIKYKLNPSEVYGFIHHSDVYQKNKKAQKRHTITQGVVFIATLILAILSFNRLYLFLSILPLVTMISIWIIPFLSMKKLTKNILKSQELSVEIFPDKIDVTAGSASREIPLDGSYESEEFQDMIFIFSKEDLSLIIPMRAVEPEFRADVVAMILSGARPRYKD